MMKLESTHDLYLAQLQDLYNAGRQVAKAFSRMSTSCCGVELRRALGEHAALTQGHLQQLERMLMEMEQFPGGTVCAAMQALVQGTEDLLAMPGEEAVREAAMLIGVQKVQHYQIAAYRAARHLALLLGREKDVGPLDQMLEDVTDASEQCWGLADAVVNARAAA